MAANEQTENLIILVMNTHHGKRERGESNFYRNRNSKIKDFFETLDPEPNFLLLQEVKKTFFKGRTPWTTQVVEGWGMIERDHFDQREEILQALGDHEATDGNRRRNYNSFEIKEDDGWIPRNNPKYLRIESYNMIMAKNGHPGSQKTSETLRYCAGQFTFQGKAILFISFHGDQTLGKNETDPRFAGKDKSDCLRVYFQMFLELKESTNSDHLIIGGDFNINLDTPEFIEILRDFPLKIVPYKKQRRGQTGTLLRKIDALICDEELFSNDIKVTVYSKEQTVNPEGYDDEGTLVKHFAFSQNSLDHDPLLFAIKITVPPTGVPAEVQAPTAEELDALAERVGAINVNDQVPSTGVQHQAPAHANQVPTEEVQAPTAGVQAPTAGVQALPTGVQISPNEVQIPSTGLQVPTSEVQIPSTGAQALPREVQIPTTGDQVPPTGVQAPTAEVQVPPTEGLEDVTEGLGAIHVNDQET